MYFERFEEEGGFEVWDESEEGQVANYSKDFTWIKEVWGEKAE